jgi:hypothetical protein
MRRDNKINPKRVSATPSQASDLGPSRCALEPADRNDSSCMVRTSVQADLASHILDAHALAYTVILVAQRYEKSVNAVILALHQRLREDHTPPRVDRRVRDPVLIA